MLNLLFVALFVILFIGILILGLRRRVLFKMGARNFVRHRTHSALVVGGLLIGTAIISAAMVTGDCVNNFIVKGTYESYDLVDVTVTNHSAYFNQSVYTEISGNSAVTKYTDGIAPMIMTTVSAEDSLSHRSEPSITLLAFNPQEDKGFGSFTKLDGTATYGDDLNSTEVIMNQNAANLLDAKASHMINISYEPVGSYYPSQVSFTVKYVVQDLGKGRYQLVPGIFINLDVAQKMLNVPNEVNLIKISGIGDVKTGVDKSDDIVKAVNATLQASSIPGAKDLVVTPDKQNSITDSENMSVMITMFITIFGSFSIIAGVILIINIFTMLAEERKSELGMARAVGMTRKDLLQMFLFEGTTYTIAAAAIGTFVGLFISFILMWGVNNVFTTFISGGIPFTFDWSSLVNAFCIGSIITFLTIIVASWRVTNINIVRAIRDIEEPIQERGSRASIAFGGVIMILSLGMLLVGYHNLILRYIVPCVTIMGFALVLHGFTSARISFSLGGLGIIAYTLYSVATYFKGNNTDMQYLFIVAGIFIVLAAVIIVMFNSPIVVGIVSGTLGRAKSLRPVVKTAVSHPLNKRFRTGMTIAMFSLVIFTIVMVSVFTGIFSINADDLVKNQGGGYQVMGTTNVPIQDINNASIYNPAYNISIPIKSPTLQNDIERCEQITIVVPTPEIKIEGRRVSSAMMFGQGQGTSLYAVDENFMEYNGFSFSNYSSDYKSPQEVWAAVNDKNSTKIVYASMSLGGTSDVKPGTVIEMSTVYGEKNFTVAGVLDSILSGIFMSKNNSKMMFNAPYSGNYLFLFKVKAGFDVQIVADNLKWDFRMIGMNAINLRATIESVFNMINAIFQLFEVFLGLGLVVGIAGLGIITIRSVVERKREIGIMRAIGFERRKILGSQILEILFIATLAIIIGAAVGIVVSYEIFNIMVIGLSVTFNIPWVQIGWVVLITYVAALACTIAPAIRASRIPPAEALRILE